MEELLKVTHKGTLEIGNNKISCGVLEDGTRILSNTAVFQAFDRPRKGKGKEIYRTDMPSFMDANNLKTFVNQVFGDGTEFSIQYVNQGRILNGYKAEIIPLICEVYLKARDEGVLTISQEPIAKAAEILVRSLAKVGIIALIDEATGYQEDRERDALQKLLSLYVAKELLPWTKTFPDEFYIEMFRLRRWDYKGQKKPQLVGKLTNYLVYDRLPEEVVNRLKELNPILKDKKYRKHKHFQMLTKEYGYQQLVTQISTSLAMMRGFDNWDDFDKIYRKSFNIDEQIVEDE